MYYHTLNPLTPPQAEDSLSLEQQLSNSNMEKIKTRWKIRYEEHDEENELDRSNNDEASNSPSKSSGHHKHHSSSPPIYEAIEENLYLDERKREQHRSKKDARSMVCDCPPLSKDEKKRGVMGCQDNCLNRMMMIECGQRCLLGEHCFNKRFQRFQSAQVEVFKTKKKGWGLRTTTELPAGSFIMEYVGEVVRSKELKSRIKKYTKLKVKHHYFMALRSDEIIDATCKGNLTRFINHSCEPNCETQKWTVNGDLRIGFFALRNLQAGEEITFDYQFQRYGRKAQKCYCGTPSCRGYIGGSEQTFSLNGYSPIRESSEERTQRKADKNGFKIPKLSRSQRKEIEARIKEELTTNSEIVREEKTETVNNPFVRNQTTKPPAPNGLVNSAVPIKRRIDPNTNNISLTPAPKMSKEEHRQQFEMSVRLKEYYDNIERHYGSAVAEQVKMSHAFSTLNGLSLPFPHHLLASQNLFYLSAAAAASHPVAPMIPQPIVLGQQLSSQSPTQPPARSLTPKAPPQHSQTVLQPQSPFQIPSIASQAQSILPSSAFQTAPTASTVLSRFSTLIVLANDYIDPADKVDDKLAFSLCDYDEYYNIRERPLEPQDIINNEAYPYPGSYYTTPEGEKWFVTVTLDRKTQKPKNVILKVGARLTWTHVSDQLLYK